MLIFLLYFFHFVSSDDNFPSIKFTEGGIFGWYDALGHMKKPFNNKKFLGFLVNSTIPDLSMIVYDITSHLDLHDLNLSQKIQEDLNKKDSPEPQSILLSDEKCEKRTGNVKKICEKFGIDLNFESLGIQEKNLNILIANLVAYIPTNLFFIIIASIAIIYYVLQLFLQCKIFKPTEHTKPSIYSKVIFYAGDALVFISAILFMCAFTGVDDFIMTLTSLDTILPRVTYSLASSLSTLIEEGIPNGVTPIFQLIVRILENTQYYLRTTAESFLTPTTIFLNKMVSEDPNDMGVFPLYNEKIVKTAKNFYDRIDANPNLNGMEKHFFQKDFSEEQKNFQDFYDSELNLSTLLYQLDSFFVYYYSVVSPVENFVTNIADWPIGDSNLTFGQMIKDIRDQSLNSFEYLRDLHKRTKENNPLWYFLFVVFFVVGFFFMLVPIYLGLIFLMQNKCSRCIASTISICPLVATILMFVLCFLLTGIGFALVVISNQFEWRIDDFLSNIIDRTIPTREIDFGTINITYQTNGNYVGILKLSPIVFPKPFTHIEELVLHNEKDGIASSLALKKIANMNRYGDEIGNFIKDMSTTFNLPSSILNQLNDVIDILKLLEHFPTQIDFLFNFGVPVNMITTVYRAYIHSKDPSAEPTLFPYLDEIDGYTKLLNSQFETGIYQLSHELPLAIYNLNSVVPRFIKSVLKELGTSTRDVLRNVYPIVDSIQAGMFTGPYAIIRNTLFYDISNMAAYISASGTLMIFGFLVVVTMMWIRRKGMLPSKAGEIGFFAFILRRRRKKIIGDHSLEEISSYDNSTMFMHDSDFGIDTEQCGNDFEVDGKRPPLYDGSFEDCEKWVIDSDGDEDDEEKSTFLPPGLDIGNPDDDPSNWMIKADEKGNFVPDSSYVCDPTDDGNSYFCINEDENGNFIPDESFVPDPEDDPNNWLLEQDEDGNVVPRWSHSYDPMDDGNNFCIGEDEEGNFIRESGYVNDPDDDNSVFIVRLDRDGDIYHNRFGEDYPIQDSINDVGECFMDAFTGKGNPADGKFYQKFNNADGKGKGAESENNNNYNSNNSNYNNNNPMNSNNNPNYNPNNSNYNNNNNVSFSANNNNPMNNNNNVNFSANNRSGPASRGASSRPSSHSGPVDGEPQPCQFCGVDDVNNVCEANTANEAPDEGTIGGEDGLSISEDDVSYE